MSKSLKERLERFKVNVTYIPVSSKKIENHTHTKKKCEQTVLWYY